MCLLDAMLDLDGEDGPPVGQQRIFGPPSDMKLATLIHKRALSPVINHPSTVKAAFVAAGSR